LRRTVVEHGRRAITGAFVALELAFERLGLAAGFEAVTADGLVAGNERGIV